MPRAAFRQAEIERIIRAAMKSGGEVHIDMKELIIRIVPARTDQPGDDMPDRAGRILGRMAPDGKENWDVDPPRRRKARTMLPNGHHPDENWDDIPDDPPQKPMKITPGRTPYHDPSWDKAPPKRKRRTGGG